MKKNVIFFRIFHRKISSHNNGTISCYYLSPPEWRRNLRNEVSRGGIHWLTDPHFHWWWWRTLLLHHQQHLILIAPRGKYKHPEEWMKRIIRRRRRSTFGWWWKTGLWPRFIVIRWGQTRGWVLFRLNCNAWLPFVSFIEILFKSKCYSRN